MKKLLLALCCALMLAVCAHAESVFEPLPCSFDPVPYAPHSECFLPDQKGYHDDSIDVRIEKGRVCDTDFMAIYVKLADASQIRSGLAGEHPSNATTTVLQMAERFGGVLTINGDYFNYHKEGIVFRNGQQLRMRPTGSRDTLIIDENGDFLIIPHTTKADYAAYTGSIVHTFCFGPGIVKDGIPITEAEIKNVEVDIGKYKQTQRLALCQNGPLEYMVVCTEGPSGDDSSSGMTIQQMGELCCALGAKWAYNLDGGNSAAVIFNGEKLNNVTNTKRRQVGDCIYFCTLVP